MLLPLQGSPQISRQETWRSQRSGTQRSHAAGLLLEWEWRRDMQHHLAADQGETFPGGTGGWVGQCVCHHVRHTWYIHLVVGVLRNARWWSNESGFTAISWSIRTEGLLDPRPGWSSRRAVFWVALRRQQDILQFAITVDDSAWYRCKGRRRYPSAMWATLDTAHVEFCEGPHEAVLGEGGVDIPEQDLFGRLSSTVNGSNSGERRGEGWGENQGEEKGKENEREGKSRRRWVGGETKLLTLRLSFYLQCCQLQYHKNVQICCN